MLKWLPIKTPKNPTLNCKKEKWRERERVQRNESANTTFSFLKRFAQKNIRNSFNILALRLKNKQIKIQILVDCYISHNRG